MNDAAHQPGQHDQSGGEVDVRAHLRAAMAAVAPDVADEIATIDDELDFYEEFGLDSMDRMSIMESLAASTGVAISDEEAPRLTSIAAIAAHVSDH